MNNLNVLYAIILWDQSDSNGYTYAIMGENMVVAGELAKKLHHEETGSALELLEVDTELSCEITCAPDKDGILYDIHFSKH